MIYSFEEGALVCRELSDQENGVLQITIEPGTWFAARLKEPSGFTLGYSVNVPLSHKSREKFYFT